MDMANVRVEQRNAHLAGAVKLELVNGREGRIQKGTLVAISNNQKGTLVAISNNRRGSGNDQATAISWTLWGKQAENAAEYLFKGSHVNVVGRLTNNVYQAEGETVFGWTFTCEEIDYLDTASESEARRARLQGDGSQGENA
jgi:single-strand DNA-binding protein